MSIESEHETIRQRCVSLQGRGAISRRRELAFNGCGFRSGHVAQGAQDEGCGHLGCAKSLVHLVNDASRLETQRSESQVDYNAFSPRSSLRIRIASSTCVRKILPSPILPVRADLRIAPTAASTKLSATTSSTFIFGIRSMEY